MRGASERCELDKLKSSLPQSRPDHGTTCNFRQATQLSTFSNLPNTQDIHEKVCKWNFLPDKICQVHVQKVCQASPAQETSERSAKKINICVSDDVEKRSGMFCMYLTTALPPPWSAFRVVISTNDKVVHKTRDRVVRRHDLIRFDILVSGPHLDAILANCDHFEPSGGSTT